MKAPARSFERLGWWLMMDLGFGSLIDKFEAYFGRLWTRIVLLLAGLTFATGCMRLIWDWAIGPLVALLPSKIAAPAQSLWIGIAFAVGAGIGTALMAAFLNWLLSKRIDRLEHRLNEVRDMAEFAALQPPPMQQF